MTETVYKITLDLHRTGSQATVNAKAGDVASRRLRVRLTERGREWPIPDGASAVLYAVKPDGTVVFSNCETEDGTAAVTLTSQTVAVPGTVDAELRISDAQGIIGTPRFRIAVEPALFSDSAVESTDEFSALTEAIAAAEAVAATAEAGGFDGRDGYSPTVSVTPVDGGHRVTVTDENGDHIFDVLDGSGTGAEVYVGDSQPDGASVLLWIDTSSSPAPAATDPVTNLAGTATSDSATLTWTASANATGYKVYQGDSLLGTVSATSYTVTGLTASTQYTFGVTATGANGDSTKVTVAVTTRSDGGLPSAYQQVVYVTSKYNTPNSAIFTGVQSKDVAKIEIGFEANYGEYQMLTFSADENHTNSGVPYIYNTLNKTAMVGNPAAYLTATSASPSSYVGESVKVDFTFTVSTSSEKYFCFGGGQQAAWAGSARNIYYCKIYDSQDTLLRDYVPCYRKSDNKVGMYDMVEGTFELPIYDNWTKGADV